MSLDKAIKHKKEKRKPYRKSARFAVSYRNHGGGHSRPCKWCEGNRLFGDLRRTTLIEENESEKDYKDLAEIPRPD